MVAIEMGLTRRDGDPQEAKCVDNVMAKKTLRTFADIRKLFASYLQAICKLFASYSRTFGRLANGFSPGTTALQSTQTQESGHLDVSACMGAAGHSCEHGACLHATPLSMAGRVTRSLGVG